jgi:glucokinase
MKIGIDLGGTTMAVGLIDDKNSIIVKSSAPTSSSEGSSSVIDRMGDLVQQLLDKTGTKIEQISHIGIGCPGMLDNESGYVLYSNNIDWNHVNLRELVHKRFEVPVYIENDANCAALGEYISGAGRQYSSMAMVTLGTGIGGAFVLNDKLFRGHGGHANIFGHMVIESGGEACNCGRWGCWEAYGSVSALVREANHKADANKESALYCIREKDGELNGNNIFATVREGDAAAKEVFDRYVFYIAEGITNLINIFDPEAIIIGGGISKEGEFLLEPVRKLVRKYAYCKYADMPVITASLLYNDAGVIGAACLYKY